jgi:hypothetical protein
MVKTFSRRWWALPSVAPAVLFGVLALVRPGITVFTLADGASFPVAAAAALAMMPIDVGRRSGDPE